LTLLACAYSPRGVRVSLAIAAVSATVAGGWQSGPPLPVARTEVAAAVAGRDVVVVGGYLADGSTTARVDVYEPLRRAWHEGRALPQPLHHAAATPGKGSAVVVGGYAGAGRPTTTAHRLQAHAWRRRPPSPPPRR